jgi:hypothetical protein
MFPLKLKKKQSSSSNDTVQWAGLNTTPEHTDMLKAYNCPILIKRRIEEKRRLHRDWHRLRTP